MNDASFLQAFEDCTLPAAEWTHEAHLRMAWLMLEQLRFDDALYAIRRGINCYNERVLKKHGAYHETITVVYTRLIAWSRQQLPPGHCFADFKAAYPLLFDNKMTALYRYYRRDTIMGDVARSRYIEPDMEPLPELSPNKKSTGTQKRQQHRQQHSQ